MDCSTEVSRFIRDTCQSYPLSSMSIFRKFDGHSYPAVHPIDESETSVIPLVTGSVAEFHIVPMLPCIGDVDVMFYYTSEVAIPDGHEPYTRLPAKFDADVKMYEIRDTRFPGYVFLVPSCLLRKRSRDGRYVSVECSLPRCPLNNGPYVDGIDIHGPASLYTQCFTMQKITGMETVYQADSVKCIRSLVWPHQAADWPTRCQNYGWPDSATVDHVVGNGCDVVPVAHPQCRNSEWMSRHQWRLSFSRAEVVLLNNWTPVQQIVYHMLRVFVKTERLAYSENGAVDNYRIKTLMLWACELKPLSFWRAESSLFAICVHLLRRFSVWLEDGRCQHYFVSKCNLFGHLISCFESQLSAVMCRSITEDSLAMWFVDNYVRKCANLCPDNTVLLFENLQTKEQLHNTMTSVERWKQHLAVREVGRVGNTVMLLIRAFKDGVGGLECNSGGELMCTIADIMFNWMKSGTESLNRDKFMSSAWISYMLSMMLSFTNLYHIPRFVSEFAEIFSLFTSLFCLRVENYPHINFLELFRKLLCSQNVSDLWQSEAVGFLKILSAKSYGPQKVALTIVAKAYM